MVNGGACVGSRGAILLIDDVSLELRAYELVGDNLEQVDFRREDLRGSGKKRGGMRCGKVSRLAREMRLQNSRTS